MRSRKSCGMAAQYRQEKASSGVLLRTSENNLRPETAWRKTKYLPCRLSIAPCGPKIDRFRTFFNLDISFNIRPSRFRTQSVYVLFSFLIRFDSFKAVGRKVEKLTTDKHR
ncbi:unnamed protein product [Macrosiphum euphorbiae]|uniref:Uncharacterized protein n=1 Tax=Macrosiphum euphorbiae TaxID=13131 RepID=A0AAV0XPG0_9HEMI|nr:unnamed protein product [Macrosiphum euphorbiae]